jgi:monoterpene epsilon-lactone hydrolase
MTHAGIDAIRSLLPEQPIVQTDLLAGRRALAELAGSPAPPEGITVIGTKLADRRAERLVPPGAPDDELILYFHGGGYTSGSIDSHRALAGQLALDAGRTVITLDYRLAPEDPFPAALNDALLAFDQLAPARIALAGDSAGGGLGAATALALRDRGGAVPVALVLFSPWVDLTQSADSMHTLAEADPMVTKAGLDQMAAAYLAGTDVRMPLASPKFANLGGLPPTRIDVGSDETLLDDATGFAEAATVAGVEVELQVWPEMIHVFQAFPAELVPEAAQSLAAAGAFLAQRFAD